MRRINMIILHNEFDKKSRKFVEIYGSQYPIIQYPSVIKYFPQLTVFPSVVIIIPDHFVPPSLNFDKNKPPHPDIESKDTDLDDDNFIFDNLPNFEEIQQNEPYLDGKGNVFEYIKIYPNPESMEEVELYLEEWEAYANAYPPKEDL